METQEKMKVTRIMRGQQIVLGILMLLCAAEVPAVYCMWVRGIAMVMFAVMAYRYFRLRREEIAIICGALAVLFQPSMDIILMYGTEDFENMRKMWSVVCVVVAIPLIVLAVYDPLCGIWKNNRDKTILFIRILQIVLATLLLLNWISNQYFYSAFYYYDIWVRLASIMAFTLMVFHYFQLRRKGTAIVCGVLAILFQTPIVYSIHEIWYEWGMRGYEDVIMVILLIVLVVIDIRRGKN